MKLTLLVFLSLMLVLQANSQDVEIERLKTEIINHPLQDTSRVNRLNEVGLYDDLSVGEMEKFANEALLISRKIHYTIGEGYALLNLGNANSLMGKKPEAAILLNQADSIARKTGDQELTAFVLMRIGGNIQTVENRKALDYGLKAEEVAQKTGNKKLLSICQRRIAATYQNSLSDYPKAMEYLLKSINSAEDADCLDCLARSWGNLGSLYSSIGDQKNSLFYYEKAADANKKLGNKLSEKILLNNIGERYRLLGNYPAAIEKYKEASKDETRPLSLEINESNLADVYLRMDSLPLAFKYGFSSLATAKKINDDEGEAWIYEILSRAYLKKNMVDSAIYYARQGLGTAKETGTIEFMRDNAGALANAYAFKKDFENAYTYHVLYINYRDSMLNAEISNKSTVLQYNYDLAKKQAQITTLDQQKKVQQNFLVSALAVLLLIIITAFILLRSNQQKQKANKLLQKQKHEIEYQRDKTNKALEDLQQAQKQLIQAEKMASLGELTAGIAHEIQNPLNFVNNFSEVNRELIEELKNELAADNREEALLIANDIKENELKIIHHGKRADSIVKGMLQHSSSNTGKKELADVNALVNECLKLSYHGLRAKDKTFNTNINTSYDESVDKIKIVSQDIGRVLLNLFNNAFYAVNEKKGRMNGAFEPTVSACTKKLDTKLEIHVKDNGNGIPQNIVDKIFQPFFTTKPTGQGTGLGLSLSYDIIKAHGGEISVNNKEGEGCEFVLKLPLI